MQAEELLRAIQRGEVDGLMVSVDGEPRVFTLDGADAFYRALVEQMPEGAAAVNDTGRLIYVNTCLAEMLGRPSEVVVGTPVEELVPADQRAGLLALLAAADEGDTQDLPPPDGRRRDHPGVRLRQRGRRARRGDAVPGRRRPLPPAAGQGRPARSGDALPRGLRQRTDRHGPPRRRRPGWSRPTRRCARCSSRPRPS